MPLRLDNFQKFPKHLPEAPAGVHVLPVVPWLMLTMSAGDGNPIVALMERALHILNRRGGHLDTSAPRPAAHGVDVIDLSALESHEFVVGIAVAAILIGALVPSSLFRNLTLALVGGLVVILSVQGGVDALIDASKIVEAEIRRFPGFSHGLVVGLTISAVMLLAMRWHHPELGSLPSASSPPKTSKAPSARLRVVSRPSEASTVRHPMSPNA